MALPLALVCKWLYTTLMEMLEQLETHINKLLARIDQLSRENAELRADIGLKENTREEFERAKHNNTLLSIELEQEKQRNNAALERIEAIIERLKEQTDE